MPPSIKVRKGRDDYYVFLRWLGPENRYQGYMLQGQEVRNRVRHAEAVTKKRGQRPFPAFYVGKMSGGRDRRWAETWKEWNL
jgi:hypothetical protein